MKRILLLLILLLCTAFTVLSLDFGLLIENEFEAKNDQIYYKPSLTPWFSWHINSNISIYASGIMFFEYSYYFDNPEISGWAKPIFRFDLTRTAIKWNLNPSISIEAGRINYDDALGFAAVGLFDGARFKAELPIGNFSAGVFYTGLLYKETALILMTGYDHIQYYEPWEENISNYFASSRLLAAFGWDMPLFGNANTLSIEFLMQFDLNGEKIDNVFTIYDDYLHSQYIEVKYEFYPAKSFGLTAGLILETMQKTIQDSKKWAVAWGFYAGMGAEMPGALKDWVNLSVKFTSGSTNTNFPAFMPISSVSQGEIFEVSISGLMVISADYSLRIHKTLYTEAFLRYYIRTYDTPLTDNSFFYGGEVWGSLSWQPLDDLRFTAGGGVFLPVLGNVYPRGTAPMWKANALLAISI